MKTVVCSVGTSAAKGVCHTDQLASWVQAQGGGERAAKAMFDRFADVAPQGEALQKTLSAEIHSLVRIGIDGKDRVVLLTSDTPDGQACAYALELYLKTYFDGIAVNVVPIQGLQVYDAVRFRREGVVNFVRACLNAVHDYGAAHVVLNPTGGYKALVPYTVLVGMIKRVPCQYIFEQSTQLLTLPPLPITFDRGVFESYRHLIERIETESSIPKRDWEAAVRYEHRELMEPLVEIENDQVTLSGVGLILIDEVHTPASLVAFLSQTAWRECLDNLCKLDDCEPFVFLERAARDRRYRESKRHVNVNDGLFWLKPGNTTDRYLVSIEGWRLLVWRAIREDQEGAAYPNQVKVNPVVDRKKLGPFTRLEFAD